MDIMMFKAPPGIKGEDTWAGNVKLSVNHTLSQHVALIPNDPIVMIFSGFEKGKQN
jgi:hypothetical protein